MRPGGTSFALCSELEEAPDLIGQDRAVEAIQFAIRMQRKGYNVYALGPTGSGRHALVEHLLRQQAAGVPTPPDWCYVNNFVDPQKPYCLQLPPGRGAGLAAAMKRLVEELRGALPAAFERDEYRSRREVIDQQFKQRNEAAFGALQKRAQQKGIALLRTPMGLALAPVRDGKVLEPDAFEALPAGERESVQHEIEATQSELEAIMRQVPQWEREHRDAVRDLSRETTGFAIVHLMGEVRAGMAICPMSRNTSTLSSGRQGKRRRLSRSAGADGRRRVPRLSRRRYRQRSRNRAFGAMGSTSLSTIAANAARR